MAMDIWKGWPNGAALEDNAKPKDGEDIVAGMFVKKDSAGELVKADGTVGEVAFFSLHDQDSPDVQFAQSLPYIIDGAVVMTDQFLPAAYVQNDALEVASGGNEGKIQQQAAGQQVGIFDGLEQRDGREMMKIILQRS